MSRQGYEGSEVQGSNTHIHSGTRRAHGRGARGMGAMPGLHDFTESTWDPQVPSIVSRHMPDVMNMQRARLGMDVGKGSEMHS